MLLLLACTPAPPATDDTATDTLPWAWDDTPNPLDIIGTVEIVENPVWDYSRVSAVLRGGPLPTTQSVVATDGDCAVLDGPTANAWECTPECTYGSQTCIDGTCVDWPEMAPTGDITITGLIPGSTTLEELSMGYYGTPDGLTGDLFAAGDSLHVTSPGAATPALDLTALGVADFDVTFAALNPGEDMTFTWSASDTPSRIQVRLETGWHGSSALTTIWCETEDDGELTIPATLTEAFVIPSCGECETSFARRFTRDVVDFGAGPIELFVASEHSFVAWWGE